MKYFQEYSSATQLNIGRQVAAQAKMGVAPLSDWVNALTELNPMLPSYPNYPDDVVGVAAVMEAATRNK